MRATQATMISVFAAALALPAVSQAQQRPVITLGAIPFTAANLSIDDFEENGEIRLQWSATTDNQTYRFEVTYVQATTTTTIAELFVFQDSQTPRENENQGVLMPGLPYNLVISPRELFGPSAQGELPENSPQQQAGNPQTTVDVVVQVFRPGQAGSDDENAWAVASWVFNYDTRRPPPPEITSVIAGENSLKLTWTAPELSQDVELYEVVWCPDASNVMTSSTSTIGVEISGLPCDLDAQQTKRFSRDIVSETITEGLVDGVQAAVGIRSIDAVGNVGELGLVRVQTPSPVTDFWELYKELGGEEEGGFCFVATAAYGSYGHPMVRVLRLFRDRILAGTAAGRGLIWLYYQLSPSAAAELSAAPGLRGAAKLALVPVVLFSVVVLLLPVLGLVAIGLLILRRIRRRWTAAVVTGLALLIVAPQMASAVPRPKPENQIGYGFEFRGGPYLPDMGNPGGTETAANGSRVDAFERIFDPNPNPLFSLALDLQLYRGFGTAGVGGSFGFMQWVGRALNGVDGGITSDTTVFNILPMTLVGFYRFDWLADNTPLPFVPYVRAGLAYYAWWVTTNTNDISRYEGAQAGPDDDVAGRGGKFGVTGTLGMAFLLNALEPSAAKNLYASTGIRGTYLFGEIQGNKVNGFGAGGFDLSDFTWNLGMYLEF